MQSDFDNDPSLQSLVEMGVQGHFPLFHPSWPKKFSARKNKTLTAKERKKAEALLQRLCQQRGLERKKSIFHTLEAADQELFIRAFLKLVEKKILNTKINLQ